MNTDKIGFGGGCHWCTEAVFQVLRGVAAVEQGWIVPVGEHGAFSEAVIVHYSPDQISLDVLTAIHLATHSCTSNHRLRSKYRSAVYTFSELQAEHVRSIIEKLQAEFDRAIITQVLPFRAFKENQEQYLDYYQKNAGSQFCVNYIDPKFELLRRQYARHLKRP